MPEPIVYAPIDRPMVAVLVIGELGNTWCVGDLRMWDQRDEGWWGDVVYSSGVAENRVDWFPAERIVRID
jgi:hypothetical protein